MSDTKTILFCLTSGDVFRTFLFFENALCDRLNKFNLERHNLKIIFVSPQREFGLNPDWGKKISTLENVVAEQVVVSPPQGFLQKAFYFFYSYLVYTGTTKVLATMGMRIGDAPGSGKKSLAILKSFIFHTFGQSRYFKRNVVPWLYHKIFRARPFREIYDTYKPDIVFAPNLFNRFDQEFLGEAKLRGIYSIGMVTGWDHYDKYFFPFRPDIFLAQNAQIERFAVKYQAYNKDEVTVVGLPYLDLVVDKRMVAPRGEILKKLGFPENAEYFLYISGSMYCPDEPDVIETMIKWADEQKFGQHNVYFVIRPYPGGRGRDQNFDEAKFNSFKTNPRVSFYMDRFWEDLERSRLFVSLMTHASAVIAIYSTASLEAAALDRPILTTAFDGYHKRPFNHSVRRFEMREHFKDVIKSGALKRAFSFDELLKYLNEYLDNPALDREKREVMRNQLLYRLDGKTSERIYDYFLKKI